MVESVPCNTQPCPTDCVTSEWAAWTGCSESCGGGTMTHSRSVVVHPSFGGTICPALSEQQTCNAQRCPVHCALGSWGAWALCDRACGSGTQLRTRPVSIGAAYGGTECGSTSESQPCNTALCDQCDDASNHVDCTVGQWGTWFTCTAQCGGGTRQRHRPVVTPASCAGTHHFYSMLCIMPVTSESLSQILLCLRAPCKRYHPLATSTASHHGLI